MALEPFKHVNGRMWPPGVSGNPNGRPVGSRTVFSQRFLKDLAEVWSEEGREAMVKTAKTNPTVFFATCARLIGPEVKLTIEQQLPGNLSPADWNLMMQILDAVKSAIPDAHTRAAGEVLGGYTENPNAGRSKKLSPLSVVIWPFCRPPIVR